MNVEQWLGEDNKLGQDIWHKKYQYNNETFDEWIKRVSGGDDEVAQLILDKKFLLGGRALTNRGINSSGSLFNCYSRGFVKDDYYDIMQACVDIGLTFKAQGGQGISLTKLRPKGTPIKDEYESDGIVPFMKIYNEVTAGTSQGGSRKGALMLSIDARHKEAETFIRIKSQEGMIEKANLSIEIDDTFMEAVKEYYDKGKTVVLHEKRIYSGHVVEYDVIPINIFKALVDNCYDWGDPACLFVNRFRNYNLMEFDDSYQIETCNPCGEQPLPKHGACCLASLNLSEFILNPYTDKAYMDTESFVRAVKTGIRALDKLIDENANKQPLKEQAEMSQNYRNVGLGIFGYATALIKLGIRYGSDKAIKFTDDIFGLMFRAAVLESNELAKEFGPFPCYNECLFDSSIIRLHFSSEEIDNMKKFGLRNCSLLSIAPTGSLATMLGESGGCEPEFAIKYTRRTVAMTTDGVDKYYDVYCKGAREYMTLHSTDQLPDYIVGASNIQWKERVKTQAIMQKHVDTAISSTVNLPNDATKDDIAHIYLLAWELGCKGITIFRDGCKRLGILTTDNDKLEDEASNSCLKRGDIIPESDNLIGMKRKLITGCGSLHCVAFFDSETKELRETYLSKGSSGGCNNFMIGLSRMISLSARAGVSIDKIIDQLNSCGVCPSYATRKATKGDTSPGSCCPIAVGKALKEMHDELVGEPKQHNLVNDNLPKCPKCGAKLIYEGGCNICKDCGWSKCD